MIERRPFETLGEADHGWLKARHHFSFADYLDRDRMGWGKLRVWNDDEIAPGTGFPPHPHRDMEIITFVRDGAISHGDNRGNRGRTVAGDVQVMSAGRGIIHSEENREDETTRIFQIWLQTAEPGAEPGWGARHFPREAGRLTVVASGYPEDDALPIRTHGRVLAATVKAGQSVACRADPAHFLYLVPDRGSVEVSGVRLNPRDGAAIRDESNITITAIEDAEIVLVDTE